jgi:hypothetical protein
VLTFCAASLSGGDPSSEGDDQSRRLRARLRLTLSDAGGNRQAQEESDVEYEIFCFFSFILILDLLLSLSEQRSRLQGWRLTVAPAASFALARWMPLFTHSLKLLPLLRGEHLLQSFISLPANLFHAQVRLLAQGLQLRSRVVENSLDLRFLCAVEFQSFGHLFKTVLPAHLSDAAHVPSAISIQGERARREAEQKDDDRRAPHLPSVLNELVHHHLPASSSES